MPGQHGSFIDGWSLKAIGVRGIGPVAEVEHQTFLLFFGLAIMSNGGEGTEEEIRGVSHYGGAAGRDLVAGLKLIEFAESVVDGGSVAEFLDVADENGGEVGLVEISLMFGGVFGAEAGIGIRDGHAATASAGGAMLTMERDRIGVGNGYICLRIGSGVHESSFRL
jgi:hypothetical protein